MNVPVAERGSLLVDELLDVSVVVRLDRPSVDDHGKASPGIMELAQETAVLHHVDKEALAATGGGSNASAHDLFVFFWFPYLSVDAVCQDSGNAT